MLIATVEASAMTDGGPSWQRATFVLGGWRAFETGKNEGRGAIRGTQAGRERAENCNDSDTPMPG
jgi:hypothetical protein